MYRGRFAPTPSGPLHFGSLVAALAGWADARAHGGEWLLRIEDVDEPRCRGEWADSIPRTIEGFGLEWDGAVVRQSGRVGVYREALERLKARGAAYGCGCSRRAGGRCGCRAGVGAVRAWRMRVDEGVVGFEDRWSGWYEQDVGRACGDFVLLRADGYFSYQLAVVVDDFEQGVTDVVRGADLLDSTPRQMVLQRALGLGGVRYLHHPVVVGVDGQKLSKQTRAAAAGVEDVGAAVRFLGFDAPEGAAGRELLEWFVTAWRKRFVR